MLLLRSHTGVAICATILPRAQIALACGAGHAVIPHRSQTKSIDAASAIRHLEATAMLEVAQQLAHMWKT